jgi:hypothetical protein
MFSTCFTWSRTLYPVSELFYHLLTYITIFRQVVTNFFKWVSEKKTGKVFTNPDPKKLDQNKNRMMDFCDYLDATWGGSFLRSFKLKGHPGGEDDVRSAQSHIAFAYPSQKFFEDDFIYLQTTVNAPAKQQVYISIARNSILNISLMRCLKTDVG